MSWEALAENNEASNKNPVKTETLAEIQEQQTVQVSLLVVEYQQQLGMI